ncbi:UNVERIFIED_CONTAM: hypothetical protein GTU68_067223 [Idotea baltica]|nr:hypothetical protein [Idotea baltica]
MKVTFLGTGTSQGIPVIACKCAACISENIKDKRLRTSAFVEVDGTNICIDIGPDFRQQMLVNKIENIDSVLITHEHNDHMIGADDLRPFNFIQKRDMPIFGEQRVLDEIRTRFEYAFIPHPYPGIPQFQLTPINDTDVFYVKEVAIQPVRILHGALPILGYRIGDFCYLTDVKTIPEEEFEKLTDLRVVVINALRRGHHHAHLTLEEAIDMAEKIGADRTFLIHFSHDLGPLSEWEEELPDGVYAAWDGLEIEI